MALNAEEIVQLYEQRKRVAGPIHEQMKKVRELSNGDVIVPLNELDKTAQASVANLLVIGLDQMSMRVASTMPTPFFPPLKDGNEKSKINGKMRKQAMQAMWTHNRMPQKMRRRARHLLGYSSSPVYLKPDFATLIPKWVVMNPLNTYASPVDDPDDPLPNDCIFTYKATAQYLLSRYGEDIIGQLRMGNVQRDTKYTMLEYVSPEAIQLVLMGADDEPSLNMAERAGVPSMLLEEIPNRTGRPLVVMPQRITLDKPRGQFDGVLGMYYTRARLQALTEIAIERGIFPEEYLVARPGENPVVVQVADGKAGQIGIVKGGDIQQQQINPGYKTDTALDRLERQERLEGSIPAEFGGESASNIRTGRRGENVLSSTVDFRIQEAQSLFESSLLEEDKIAIAIEQAYWGNQKKSFYIPGMTGGISSSYIPNQIWETDFHYVSYSAAGSDVNSLVVSLGQRLGAGLISKESARETDPLISDPDMEHDRLIAEGVESALLVSIQEQASNPMGPYQPDDLAYLTRLVIEKDLTLYDAVTRTQQRAQDRQAAMVEASSPQAQPGLAMPDMGGQSQAAPPQVGGLEGLLAQLGGQ